MTIDEMMNPKKMSVDNLLIFIIALAHDYDGYRKPESLMGLIDEIVIYVKLIREKLLVLNQLDTETGLIPCGCGGKARIEESPFADDVDNIGLKIYTVGCTDCTIGFEGYFTSNEDAQEHWNRAMSGGMCNHEN